MTETLDRLLVALADRYTLERELGRGGMATVYLAQDLRHRRQVALKVLHSELGPERFLREIELTAAITPWGADLAQRYPEQTHPGCGVRRRPVGPQSGVHEWP